MKSMNVLHSFRCILSRKLTENVNMISYRNLRRYRDRSGNELEFSKLEERLRNHLGIQDSKPPLQQISKPPLQASSPLHTIQNEDPPLENSAHISVESKIVEKEPSFAEKVTSSNQYEMLTSVVAPLYHKTYEKQLKYKYKKSMKVLKRFGKVLTENGAQIATGTDLVPCVLDQTIPSPVTEHYRNKDEFSIRTGVDGDPKTVGFFLSSPADDQDVYCVGPDELPIIKESHKMFAHLFQNYIKFSLLPACHNFDDGGHWRNLIVRSNNKGDVMGIVIMHPQNLTQEQLNEEKQKLKSQFINSPRLGLNLTSFYFQACRNTRCSHAESPFQLIFGEPYIFEEMNGIKFRISPESFFQTNTAAAEKLYKVIFNSSRASRSTTILDICCGIGPVSFTFAPHVKHCIGIDHSAEAIEDAKANAKINGFNNVEFHAGRCEEILSHILNDNYFEELIAVINPARGMLGKNVFRLLRECKHLKKVIYVSCKPDAAIDQYFWLCEPMKKKKNLGFPFYPMRAVPIDLFPQTSHYELVMLFQRINTK